MPVVSLVAFPEFAHYSELKCIFVGGCVERGDGSSFRAMAHAHTGGKYAGWICVRSKKRLYINGSMRTSQLMWHELAHLVANDGHTDKWREVMRRMGQPIPKRYKKQKRRR